MCFIPPLHLNPKKLLLSKWTAVAPQNKEKHFLVVTLVMPDAVYGPIEHVELEAVHSRQRCVLPWRDLTDASRWLQGWK